MSEVRLYLFGTPRIEYQGTPVKIERRKAFALVAYLALTGQPQSRDAVAALLWPNLDQEHARSALRSALRALTTPVPVQWIQANRATLALKHEAVWVDVNNFSALLAQCGSHSYPVDTVDDDSLNRYREALALYQADFLSGFHLQDSVEYDNWQLSQQEWLRRELGSVLRELAHYEAKAERYEPAIAHARHWLALDELHEPAHRLLMRLFAACGQRSEALRQYQHCVDVLNRELASPPEEETSQLYAAIQDNQLSKPHVASLNPSPAAAVLPPLPLLIVGRDDALQAIKARLGIGEEMRPLTIIQGWPGVGKSTIVALLAHDAEIVRKFPDGVLWASLGETPDIPGQLNAWARALRLGTGLDSGVEETSAQIAAALREKRVLLIVDDVWRPAHVQPFRVGGQSCALVLTTRLNDIASSLAPTAKDIYRLSVLSEAAGLELLRQLAPEAVDHHPDATRELTRDLEGLPLAIHVAGRLLQAEARLGWGVDQLLIELRQGANLLKAQPPRDMIGVEHDTLPTVAVLLKRSTDSLDADLRGRFALLGLFVPKPATFDLDAMAAAWDVPDPRTFARQLVNRGLLEPVGGGRFQMHALLVLHARSLLEAEFGNLR